jgi:hypothetical protein
MSLSRTGKNCTAEKNLLLHVTIICELLDGFQGGIVSCREFLGKTTLGVGNNHLLLSRRFCLAVILGSCGRARKRPGTCGRLRKKGFARWVAFTEDVGGARCEPGEEADADVGGEDVARGDGDGDFSIGDAREVNAACSSPSSPMRSYLCFETGSLSSASLPPLLPVVKNEAHQVSMRRKSCAHVKEPGVCMQARVGIATRTVRCCFCWATLAFSVGPSRLGVNAGRTVASLLGTRQEARERRSTRHFLPRILLLDAMAPRSHPDWFVFKGSNGQCRER